MVLAVWLAVLVTFVCMARIFPFAADAKVYETAVKELQSGISPYAAGIARLEISHTHSNERTMNYIYPPVTLPLIRAIGSTPAWLHISAFWLLYGMGLWLVLRTQERFFLGDERWIFFLLSPLCVFFPGLLNDDFLLAGNIAPILYGIVYAAAVWDWEHRQWKWFYIAVLFCSIFKLPLLTLLAIPMLTAVGQLRKAIGVGVIGGAIYSLQGLIWPEAFRQYRQMMTLEVLNNNEMGFGPAGLLTRFLIEHNLPYTESFAIAYLVCAAVIIYLLRAASQQYLAGQISAQQWFPVLLIGVILLNPRIKQYDAEAVTLPMAIVAWRLLVERIRSKRWAAIAFLLLFAAGNALAAFANAWDLTEMLSMVSLFGLSAWSLLRTSVAAAEEAEAIAVPDASF
jgi:hypothetical protein